MNKFGVGQPVPRSEDPRFLTGRGVYVDDIVLPRQTHAVFVRAPHAHARVRRIDTRAAAAAPGVVLVATAKDIAAAGITGIACHVMPADMHAGPEVPKPLRPLLVETVRHVGDRVAIVVAETPEAARDAAERVDVDYEILPAASSIGAAMAKGAPAVWPEVPDNVSFTLPRGDKLAVDAAFAAAHHVSRLAVVNNRVSANTMEPRGCMATHDVGTGETILYTSTQMPHAQRQALAELFRVPENHFRVIARDVGGGFGMKGTLFCEDALLVWATRKVGRPVRWTADRSESHLADEHGRDQIADLALAFDKDGRILALRAEMAWNLGAYLSSAAAVCAITGLGMLTGVYHVPLIHAVTRGVFTHTQALAPYRGAGRPEAIYQLERLIDLAAREMKIAPAELRRRNYIPASAMPYTTSLETMYDSGDFTATMDKALAVADWNGFAARRAESERRGRRRGIGLCYYIEISAFFNERMEIRFEPGGTVTVLAGTFSHGQGHETVYAQLVSDWLGVPFESVRLIQGDTNAINFGRGTFGSRSGTQGGSALKAAADIVIEKGRKMAAFMLEAAEGDIEFKDGLYRIAGTDKAVPIQAVAGTAFAIPFGVPATGGIGLEAEASFGGPPNFPNGCQVCEVEVDLDTGKVEIVRFTTVNDVGFALNPLLLHGQIHGGLAQGIGQALCEAIVFDEASGQLLSGSFMDYCMPRADDFCSFVTDENQVPCQTNPLGVKGAGEAGTVGAPPAVVNAIVDALGPLGVTHVDMPATPERVWQAIRAARVN
ncbi:MAG: xanthine dehydrogenase family protein molybdopterin-binding subunit [Alphaproteobacteria bacterium]|nr:xanthine dehydrogenase family protein molybdopterin-binding subunit [Alphaproteobacteria bacterium]